jgi:hypothetical protein
MRRLAALTPGSIHDSTDGSTIDVLIDNVPVGHPTYGFARADIDAPRLHQQRRRRSVFYIIDTTTRLNGLTAQFLI